MVSEVFHFKSMGANDPQDMAILDRSGFIDRFYVGVH